MAPILLISKLIHTIPDDSDDLHENKWVAITVSIVVFSLAVWKLIWPAVQSMRANNIFKKEKLTHYGKAEKTGRYNRFSPMQGLVISIGLNVLDILFYTYHRISANTTPANPKRYDYTSGSLFVISLFFVIALFIYTFIDESEFDVLRDFKYAIKIWLTTLLVSPVTLLLIYNNHLLDGKSAVAMFFGLVITVHGAGVFAFGTLLLAVNYFSRKTWSISKKRSYIFLSAEAALLTSIFVLALVLHYGWGWLLAWLVYAIVMGLAIMYYKMDPAIYSDDSYETAEIIE